MTATTTELDSTLQDVVRKIEQFALSLTPNERDVLAAIFQLSAVGASQTPRIDTSSPLLINLKLGGASAGSSDQAILATLPTRVIHGRDAG